MLTGPLSPAPCGGVPQRGPGTGAGQRTGPRPQAGRGLALGRAASRGGLSLGVRPVPPGLAPHALLTAPHCAWLVVLLVCYRQANKQTNMCRFSAAHHVPPSGLWNMSSSLCPEATARTDSTLDVVGVRPCPLSLPTQLLRAGDHICPDTRGAPREPEPEGAGSPEPLPKCNCHFQSCHLVCY